jgi:hypothetical protein
MLLIITYTVHCETGKFTICFYVHSLEIQQTERCDTGQKHTLFLLGILFTIWKLQTFLDQEPYIEFGGTKNPFDAVAFKIQ